MPFLFLSCQNSNNSIKEINPNNNSIEVKKDSLQDITVINIDNNTLAPIAFFYLDPFDNMGIFTKNKSEKNAKIEKKIIGNDNIILRYSLPKMVVPFIFLPNDSIEIGFTKNLIPVVTFSKFGYKDKYNTFSDMTERGGTIFSSSNLFISHPQSINIDSLYQNDSSRLAEIQTPDSFSYKYKSLCFGYLKSQYYLQKLQKDKIILDVNFIQNGENLQFHNFRDLLGEIEYIKNVKNNKREEILMPIYFNSALSNKGVIKDYLLYYTIKWMNSKNKKLFELYKPKFIKNCLNQDYINQIIADVNIGDKSDFYSFNDTSRSSLIQILKNNLGKLVYVDLWASWCAPCRASMPSSKLLESKYNKSLITFIYASIDENVLAWKKAVKEETIEKNRYNYIITNQKQSDFIKKYKISTIPRYLLFDKKGNIINDNAPSPESPELEILLNKLLPQ